MNILTKLKQQGLAFAAFFYASAVTSIDCYSRPIIPTMNGSNESHIGWNMNGTIHSKDNYQMKTPNSYIETIDFIDLKKYNNITISIKYDTYGNKSFSNIYLQISDNGIDWKDLRIYNLDKKEYKKGISEQNYSLKYEDFNAHNKVKLRYYCPKTDNEDFLKVYSTDIDGLEKSIEYPIIKITNKESHSCTIDWQTIPNADSFRLALYKKVNKESVYKVIDETFSTLSLIEGSFDGIERFLPNWSAKGISYKIRNNNQYISLKNEDKKNMIEISNLDLSNDNGSYIISFDYRSKRAEFRVITNNNDITIQSSGDTDSWKHYTATQSDGNEESRLLIKIRDYPKDSEVEIDNIQITQKCPYSYELINDYPKTTENKNSYSFEDLEANSDYFCTIRASNELITSKEISINFKTEEEEIHTDINTISQENTAIWGSKGYLYLRSPIVIPIYIYSITGNLVYAGETSSIELPLLDRIYIIKYGEKTKKINLY